MSSVSTHLKILQPCSFFGPSVHISLDMQALVASFRQTRLAEWCRTFWRVAAPGDVWSRSVPKLGSNDRGMKPSEESKQHRLSVLFPLLQNTAPNSRVQDEIYNMLFMTSKEIIRQRWHSLLPNLIRMTSAQTQLIGTYPKISYSL